MNLPTLLALYNRCELTPHHAATEAARLINSSNVNEVMSSLPPLLRDALKKFVSDYQPGRMLSNYGESHIPSPESIEYVKTWLIENERGQVGREEQPPAA